MSRSIQAPSAIRPVVWSIAGSDSGGGAGVQADLLTMQDLGCHGCSVLTCLTAQSSVAVSLVEAVSLEMFRSQLDTLLQDLPPAVIKIGLLVNQIQIFFLANWLENKLSSYKKRTGVEVSVILDPVMFASCGDTLTPLLDFSPFRGLLSLITPNIAELAALVDKSDINASEMIIKQGSGLVDQTSCLRAAKQLSKMLICNVLAKGGDLGPNWHLEYAHDIFICAATKGSSALHQ